MIIRIAHTDKGEYELQDVEVFNEETEQMETVQQEVCIREPYTHQDIRKIVPDWNGGRDTRRLTWDKGEFYYEDEQYEEDGQTQTRQVKVYTREPSGKLVFGNDPHVSGARIDIIDAGDRVITPAEYTEEGELITEAVMAGETRFDIHVPDDYPIPELTTQVFPAPPDKQYA